MLKKLQTILLCSGALLASSTFATSHELAKHISTDYDLPPGEFQIMKNHFPWKITATCEVRAEQNEADELTFQATKNRVIVNGVILDEGLLTTLLVRLGDKIYLEVDSLAEAAITNHGQHLVNLRCST